MASLIDYFYHATYVAYRSEIEAHGLKSNGQNKNWNDSKTGVIYLSKDPENARSYAETSENVSDDVFDSGIIIYRIPKSELNPKKIFADENVIDGIDTFEYHRNIPFDKLEIFSIEDKE